MSAGKENKEEGGRRAVFHPSLKTLLCALSFSLYAVLSNASCAWAQMSSDFVPPDTHILAKLKGQWQFRYDSSQSLSETKPPVPSLRFSEGRNVIEIAITHTLEDFMGDEPIVPRNYFQASISDFYFDCNGGPLILWFENGDSAETAPATCNGDDVKASMLRAGAMPDSEKKAEQEFAQEITHHRPVAISQGQYSLMLDYEENGSLKRFTRANNPKTNPGYFEAVKKYFLAPKEDNSAI